MEMETVHFDPRFKLSSTCTASMSSIQEEIEAIHSVSEASGACVGWPDSHGLVSWRITEDLTSADLDQQEIQNRAAGSREADVEADLRRGEEGQPNSGVHTVHEGWVMKRGEHFKNWRQRYFVLKSDGQLLGYRSRPVNQVEEPSNNFTARGCQIMCTEEPRPNCLVVRGLYSHTVAERLFSFQDSTERDKWFEAIIKVRNSLQLRGCAERKVSLHDFQILKVLGRGAFGKVVMCREKNSQNILAMKILKKSVLFEKQEVEHTKTENRVLQSLRHPFLVNLRYSFTTTDRVFFVMEYVGGGEIFEHIGRLGKFPEEWIAFYGAEIVLALGYLHRRGIIYRDLKLENLILDTQGHLKIVDFGLCKDEIFGGRLAKTMCGTPAYMAPEVFVKRVYDRAVDWWSLGIVIYEMSTGELPFYSDVREEMFRKILKEKLRYPRSSSLSSHLKELVEGLLQKEARHRLGASDGDAAEVMVVPFFKQIDWNLLEKRKLTPPFKPQVKHETDNPYIAPEFSDQSTDLTPTKPNQYSCSFSDFSFKKSSLSQSSASRDQEVAI